MVHNKILKSILSIVLVAILSMHVSKWLFIGPSINQLSIPFFLLMLVGVIKENRKIYFLSFYFIAIFSIITLESPDDLAPSMLMFIALLYYGNRNTLILCLASIPSAFIINSFIANYTDFFNVPISILGNGGILIFLYYAVIRQPSSITHLARITPLDARQLIILKYLSRDMSRKEMPDKIPERELWKHDIENFTFDIINSEISKIKKILDIHSEFALGIWYSNKCEISRNPSKS